MCNKSVDNYAHALKFIRDQYKAHGMCIKAVDNYPSTIKYVTDLYKTPCPSALVTIQSCNGD